MEINNRFIDYTEEKFFSDIDRIKESNQDGKDLTYLIHTYGCQMNEHDSEKISWILELMGYRPVREEEEADFIVFNTCAIRENAELKVYGKLGSLKSLKEDNPNLKIAVCGCMMQLELIREEIEDKHSHVDLIFGTHNIHKLPGLFLENLKTGKTAINILEDNKGVIEGLENNREDDFKAYVNIMYGCNNFCTYCVVPYTRGRELSRDPDDILNEVKKLANKGYKELMLLGQNVNSYGKSLPYDYNFTDLLKEINQVEGIERIRFMTSHPKDISDELIESFAHLDKLANHIHLPVQSGSNRILKEMNRKYKVEDYLEKIEKIRRVRPDIAISTDIIVGFPGETEEDFEGTMELIKRVEYDFVYNFIYSIRPGTKAGLMEDQIPYEIKHDRFERLNEAINEIMLEKNQKFLNKEVEVLVEELSKNNEEMLSGRTEEFKLVHFPGDKDLIGEILKVRIKKVSTFSMEGEIVD